MSQTKACAVDALLREMLDRVIEFVLLARRERELRAHFAQRLGDLQAEAARAAGDDRGAPGQIEKLS